jgi:uncharacterized protein DUF4407
MINVTARGLRAVTGVDEEILAEIPTERPRYSAMGGVILGTSLAAMLSMGIAIGFVRGGFPLVALPVVIGWGLFVLAMDRWMMAAVTTSSLRARALRLLPRLLLALLVGVVVAEPLVLVVFGNEITQRSDRERQDALGQLETDLLACNPVPGTAEARTAPTGTPRCADRQLVLTDASVAGKQAQITDLQGQATKLDQLVQTDSKAYAAIEAEARKECLGTSGPGLTGLRGQGPNCKRLRDQADQYRADHRIPENTAALAALNSRIDGLNQGIGQDSDAYASARRTAVEARVDEARKQQGVLGPLERMRVLGHLTSDNGYALAGEWALRVFLILIDALPVLVKFLSGFTTYDEIVEDQLRQRKNGELAVNQVIGERRALVAQLWRRSDEAQFRTWEKQIEADGIRQQRHQNALIEQQVDARADQLIGETPTLSFTLADDGAVRRPDTRRANPADHRRAPAPREPENWADRPLHDRIVDQ